MPSSSKLERKEAGKQAMGKMEGSQDMPAPRSASLETDAETARVLWGQGRGHFYTLGVVQMGFVVCVAVRHRPWDQQPKQDAQGGWSEI